MKSSFAILVFISILSCLSNKSNEKEMGKLSKKILYEDIDFVNMKGIKVLGDDVSKEDVYFEIIENESNVEIISYVKHQSLSKGSENTIDKDKEVFDKKNEGYYFSKEWIDEDNPEEKLKKEVFIIDKKIISVLNIVNIKSKKNVSSKVQKVDLINKEIESLKFYKKNIKMASNINIDELIKNEKPFSYTKTIIKTDSFGLLLEHNFKNFQDNAQEQYQEKYSGYPKKGLNNYWNLYKNFYGNER